MPSSSKDGDDNEKKTSWIYDGSEDEWDSFDRRIMRYMRKKYGSFGELLWQGDLTDYTILQGQDFSNYCEEVWDAIELHDSTRAKEYWITTSGFWSKRFQGKWRERQYILLKDHIEEHARGNAEVAVVNYDGDPEHIRQYLYKQFGSGSGGDIHVQETEFEAGLPENGKVAFPHGVDMKLKLQKLESRRRYFFNMCKPSKRATYAFCWESKLVRIVLDHVNSDYKGCVARLLDKVQMQKQIKQVHKQVSAQNRADGSTDGSDDVSVVNDVEDTAETDLADAHDRSFNDDWLPTWAQLKSALIDEYGVLLKEKKSGNTHSAKLPVAAFTAGVTCYACGVPGHKKGAPECKAKRNAVHSSAPAEYKARKQGGHERKGPGKSPGSNTGGNTPMKDKPCYQFDFGKGVCRYGPKCKFSHAKVSNDGGGGAGKFSNSQKKAITTMVSSSIKKVFKDAIGKRGKKRKSGEVEESDDEDTVAAIIASLMMMPARRTVPRTPAIRTLPTMTTGELHDVAESIGIDSDGAVSCSRLRGDFPLWLDTSPEACNSIPAPSGVGGGGLVVGGIGPLLCRAKSGEYFLDPEGVFLTGDGPNFRILAVQRFKVFGVRLVGCYKDTERDVWQDRRSRHVVDLSEEGPALKKILVLKTQPIPFIPVTNELRVMVSEISKGNRSGMITKNDFEQPPSKASIGAVISTMIFATMMGSLTQDFQTTAMIFNEAKLNDVDLTHLYCAKFGFPDTAVFPRMSAMKECYGKFPKLLHLNEDSTIQDAAKFKRKSYHRKPVPTGPCWKKSYCDGYGGGSSLGGDSYEGAKGGYLFCCPTTGEKIHKLYASHEQFPICLFQFLTEVEAQGYVCHELYVDTYIVNESAEAEMVAALFGCIIVPVSNGSPQEVAFVETAHRVVGQRSRAMLLNAPHLPAWAWALSDKYAIYTGRFLPQSTRGWKSAYYLSTGKVPNWRALCIHVFGAPCRYAPPEGPVHKRAEVTVEGYFAGVQHPMALVIRKSDMKLVSVSTKKLHVYESMYCGPLVEKAPPITDADFIHAEVKAAEDIQQDESLAGVKPKAAHSIKSMRAHLIPTRVSSQVPDNIRPPTTLDDSAQSQSTDPGEGEVIPEHQAYTSMDQLAVDIEALREKVENTVGERAIREKLVAVLKKACKVSGREIDRGELKSGKRQKRNKKPTVTKQHAGENAIGHESPTEKRRAVTKCGGPQPAKKLRAMHVKVGDLVSADPTLFDGDVGGSFSSTNPERQFGLVTKVLDKRKFVRVQWTDGEVSPKVRAVDVRVEKRKLTVANVLTVLILEGKQVQYESADKSNWPADFFHALVKRDWRSWVTAVKKEISSWDDFDAYTLIPIEEKKAGASIVPLGELYTRKRDQTYKFRQYLLGNLLRKGKDFTETFSSTVSWDGIRWGASVACATGKQIYGLDAVTGFLQASEQYDLYAYLPSHGEYSNLSYEELALFREKLLDVVHKKGDQGLKAFARNHKRESRNNPKFCYKLNQCIYGSPSANHEFEMLFQAAHLGGSKGKDGKQTKGCGLTLSEVEPSVYVKILVDGNDIVVDWLIVLIWTDDARYFGTDRCREEYENQITKEIKVKLLGECEEFVGTEFHQDLNRGLCELKAPKYWELAAEKFKDQFPNGLKARGNPMSVNDERIMMEEVSDEEFNEAKVLPFRELCGVVSYPAACSKLEMRFAVSVCGRYRDRWGRKQFGVLKKAFEYGWTTRETGIIYSQGLDPHGKNVISCHADSAHSIPRSQGCHLVMMNGGVISCESKRHTVTGASTCHDELIQFAKAANKVAGFRNLSEEMGMADDRPTTIYQDNESAIQITMNRGSLSNRSKHMDRTVLRSRNKVEDGVVLPVFRATSEMWADLGTKALPDAHFKYLRDNMNGYSLVKIHHPTYLLPEYIV